MPPPRRRPTAAQKRAADEVRVRRARALYEARASLRPPEPEFEFVDLDAMESELITQTGRELQRLGKLHTMLGAQALVIAREIVRGEGSALATLSKEHSRLMAAIAAGESTTPPPDVPAVPAPDDPLDVAVRAAEEKRRRAAGGGGS